MIRPSAYFAFAALSALIGGPPALAAGNISAVWANDGGDKVSQDELRASTGKENLTGKVINRTWNGQKILLYGAHNEVISFNLVLEAASKTAEKVTVKFDRLNGPGGSVIQSVPTSGNGVFSSVNRPIELFYTRYLQIKGLSDFGYNPRIEVQVPIRFHAESRQWNDRPDHDKFYPDILVPLELVPSFNIRAGSNQSIWADIYIPKTVPAGLYTGVVTVSESGVATREIPVELRVYGFTLPDKPSSKTMVFYSGGHINQHYFGSTYVDPNKPEGHRARLIRDRYYQLAHRHKLSLIGNPGCVPTDSPCPEDIERLDGSAFLPSKGYDGPGVNTGQDVYVIAPYGGWSWKKGVTERSMWEHTDAWVSWFDKNLPKTEYMLYLIDEPQTAADIAAAEQWAGWIRQNPGVGRRMLSFVTFSMVRARKLMPSVSIPATWGGFGDPTVNQPVADFYRKTPGRRLYMYNGGRPGIGSFVTEDEGVALRELPWAQYKMGIQRWFYWMLNGGPSNLWTQALTFGSGSLRMDPVRGQVADLYSNGEGVLVYPGTNMLDPANSYGVDGPFASVRLKSWRRGIQDVDYLKLAAKINPDAVRELVNKMVPKALWEVGVSDPKDPTWVVAGISWPVDPDVWENARAKLAAIIESGEATLAQEAPPVISDITVSSITSNSVEISWSTDDEADTSVEYGVTASYGNAASGENAVVSHSVTISGLTPGTLYHFRVKSSSDSGATAVSDDQTFRTKSASPSPINVAARPISIFQNAVPTGVFYRDSRPVELGVKFRSDVDGWISGIRFYKMAGDTGKHSGSLWTAAGELLGSGEFLNETASGWQQMTFAKPIPIKSNTTYIASYHTSSGYLFQWNYFRNKGADNGPLHALQNGADGPNSVQVFGPGGQFPTSTYEASNYWVDVGFSRAPAGARVTSAAMSPACAVPAGAKPDRVELDARALFLDRCRGERHSD